MGLEDEGRDGDGGAQPCPGVRGVQLIAGYALEEPSRIDRSLEGQ